MTRQDVATYVEGELALGNRSTVVRQAAAWLITSKRTGELDYLANDIAAVAARAGYVAATVTTALPASDESLHQASAYLINQGAKTVELTSVTEPKLIGGVVITTPTETLDLSLKTALSKLSEGDQL